MLVNLRVDLSEAQTRLGLSSTRIHKVQFELAMKSLEKMLKSIKEEENGSLKMMIKMSC